MLKISLIGFTLPSYHIYNFFRLLPLLLSIILSFFKVRHTCRASQMRFQMTNVAPLNMFKSILFTNFSFIFLMAISLFQMYLCTHTLCACVFWFGFDASISVSMLLFLFFVWFLKDFEVMKLKAVKWIDLSLECGWN